MKLKAILPAVALVVVLAAAALLYPALSKQFSAQDPIVPEATAASEQTAQPQTQTQPAPDFEALDADGNTVRLSDFAGKPVVINFWATWCGYCVQELPGFNNCFKDYGEDVVFMMVDLTDGARETVEAASEFIRARSFDFPVYYDTSLSAANAYGLSSIPLTVFVNADGSIFQGVLGSMEEDALRSRLDALLGRA